MGPDGGRDATSSDLRSGDGPGRDQTSEDASRAGADVDPSDRGADAPPCVPTLELCNGVDDDCDGQTDEREGVGPESSPLVESCYTGDPATLNRGPCARGSWTCEDGKFGVVCSGQVVPSEELCNGKDDDCDGSEDEDSNGLSLSRACYDGDPAGLRMGAACQQGFEVCDAADWGACRGQTLPSAEDCDGVDDDCDGLVDEGRDDCGCAAEDERDCGAQPELDGIGECRIGSQRCDVAQLMFGSCNGEVRSTVETCNGLDDDCNRLVDDDIDGVGTPCAVQSGACVSRGRYQCLPDAGGIICDAVRPVVGVEVCNALDDDCDGSIDERLFVDEPCLVGIGACSRLGLITCRGGGEEFMCDAVAGDPDPEVCNAVDDDCDLLIDEDIVPLSCHTGFGGACEEGSKVCVEGEFGACMPPDGPPESCNAVDDDCDGETDERLVDCETCQVGQGDRACWSGDQALRGVGQCRDGIQRCGIPPQWDVCVGEQFSVAEVCDGFDNDCDGFTDEDLTMACREGQGICFAEGFQRCLGGEGFGACEVRAVEPQREFCNQLDDDCDGSIDEGFAVDEFCTEGDGDCRTTGTTACAMNGTVFCNRDVIDPSEESCDSRDNDCDGRIDEVVAVACIVRGLAKYCEDGHIFCLNGGEFCRSDRNGVEECNNNIDDDCDGVIDPLDTCAVIGIENGLEVLAPCRAGETRACWPGEPQHRGVGQCNVGSQVCRAAGQWDLCVGARLPEAEVCDGADNDCDGRTDEGFPGVCVP